MQTTLKPTVTTSILALDDSFWSTWKKVRPLVVKALVQADEYAVEDVLRYVSEGRWTLWHSDNSVCFTRFAQYAQHKACIVVLCAGDIDEIRDLEPDMCKWARQHGCKYLEFFGRRGWGRALDGFKEHSTTFRKAL